MIDRDEDGRPEEFFEEALPCENCGRPCEERFPADWDADLQVGICCKAEVVEEIPLQPRCFGEYAALMGASTVGEMVDAVREHRASCSVCKGERKGIGREDGRAVERGRDAA